MDFAEGLAVGVKPLHGFLETFAQVVASLKSEEFFGPADIQTSSGLAVWFGGVPCNLSSKAGFRCDHGGQIADGDFLPCSQVDWSLSIIVFCGKQDTFRRILHI